MAKKIFEVVAIIVGLALLASIFVPALDGHGHHRPTQRCANNLGQLYQVCIIYSQSHRGEWPDAQGENLWLFFRKTVPPLIEADHAAILHCTASDHDLGVDETHYRGPRGRLILPTLPRMIGAYKIGNHGESCGGNVLFMDGHVEEVELRSDLWGQAAATLSP